MIFVDFVGDGGLFARTREEAASALAGVLRVRAESVVIRRFVTEGGADSCELWVELSSEEQLARRGRDIAQALTTALRAGGAGDVWVMFRLVPLSQAFLNGEPRTRGRD